MNSVRKRTFSLPIEQSRQIDDLVKSGRYASASEVVRAGLHALHERDLVIDRWLYERTAAAHTKIMTDPEDHVVTADHVFEALRQKIAEGRSE